MWSSPSKGHATPAGRRQDHAACAAPGATAVGMREEEGSGQIELGLDRRRRGGAEGGKACWCRRALRPASGGRTGTKGRRGHRAAKMKGGKQRQATVTRRRVCVRTEAARRMGNWRKTDPTTGMDRRRQKVDSEVYLVVPYVTSRIHTYTPPINGSRPEADDWNSRIRSKHNPNHAGLTWTVRSGNPKNQKNSGDVDMASIREPHLVCRVINK